MAYSARIDELEKKFSENARRYFAPLANEYRKAGDLDRAIEICRAHLPQQPGHMSGHIVFGQNTWGLGHGLPVLEGPGEVSFSIASTRAASASLFCCGVTSGSAAAAPALPAIVGGLGVVEALLPQAALDHVEREREVVLLGTSPGPGSVPPPARSHVTLRCSKCGRVAKYIAGAA